MATVKQGDSLFIDYSVPNFRAIDSTWSNWTGTYDIAATTSGTSIVSGTLTRSDTEGVFYLRLLSSNSTWTAMSVGTYKLMVEIVNTTVGYREEQHLALRINTQGV